MEQTRDMTHRERALELAVRTHGATALQGGQGDVDRPDADDIIGAARTFLAYLAEPERRVDGPPPQVHPERGALNALYTLGQRIEAEPGTLGMIKSMRDASDSARGEWATKFEISPDEASHAVYELLVTVMEWAHNEAEPF